MEPSARTGPFFATAFDTVFSFACLPPIECPAPQPGTRDMTYHPKSDFMATIMQRGFIADCTDYQALDDALNAGMVTAYIGYDATAKSLHVGHLMNVMMLRWLQKTGHQPITLMGGGTTKVGDPSFRADERPLLSAAQIDDNISGMQKVFARFLDYDHLQGSQSAKTVHSVNEFDLEAVLHNRYFDRNNKSDYGDFKAYLNTYPAEKLARIFIIEKFGRSGASHKRPEDHSSFGFAMEAVHLLRNSKPVPRKNHALMLNNAEWLDGLNYLEFLRDIGRHFSVNRMLSFESVKSRLDREQSLSFLEFNYMILQAYDFLELNRRYGCLLQMGGSDQWGNIVNGIDLTRRVLDNEIYGLTTPLLTTSDGRKMGKSASGAVWLNDEMLSPYEYWQFWRNSTDADVGRFLKIFTELPVEECDRLGALGGSEINDAKVILANEVTTLLHGADAAAAAEATAREVFEKGGIGDDLPTLELTAEEVGDGISVAQLIVRSGLAKTGKEAKRLIADNGARIDDAPLTDAGLMLDAAALASPVKLSAGKKRHALVKLAG
jgi:tyrosyl-tRNA synthetase